MRKLSMPRHRAPRSGRLRLGNITRIRAAIRAGHYDDEARLSVAIDRLMDSVLRIAVGTTTAAQ